MKQNVNTVRGLGFNVPLKKYSSFGIGGPAKYFFEAKTEADLRAALDFARRNKVKYFILGGGTNVLFGDAGYKGLVIRIGGQTFSIRGLRVTTEAGANLQKVAMFSARLGLAGLEKLSGIPGTIGGAVRGNAGTREGEIADFVESARVFDVRGGRVRIFKKRDLKFSYRNSLLKKRRELIVISVVLKLKKAENPSALAAKPRESAALRSFTQPAGLSCGCVFMNPSRKIKGRLMSAGELIDKAGLKGTRIGGVVISEKHANFFINTGGATSRDILRLIELVKKRVYKKFKIKLKEEIEIAG